MSLDSLNRNVGMSRVDIHDIVIAEEQVKQVARKLKTGLSHLLDIATILVGVLLKYVVDVAPLFFSNGKFRPFRIWHVGRLIKIAVHGWNMIEAIVEVLRSGNDNGKLNAFRVQLENYWKE